MRHTTDLVDGEINFPNVGDQVKSSWGLMLFRKNDSDDLFFFLIITIIIIIMVIVIPQEAHVLLAYKKGKALFAFFFFITESLWKQPMSEKFYLSSWFYFKRIPLCVSTRTRGRELWPRYFVAYSSSNANIPAFLYIKWCKYSCLFILLGFLVFFCFRKFSKFSKVIDLMFKYVSCV